MMTMKPGMKTRKKAAFRVYNDTVIGYDVFPVILQNLRPSGLLFSKETVREKFQIAREKVVVTCHHRHIQSFAYGHSYDVIKLLSK